ncbi:MAG TPA: FecR family protein [Puia sp.]|nr:FecR family protein [Puia sp.]
MEKQYLIYLVQQYLSGQLTASQRGELWGWLESEGNRAAFVDIVMPMMLAGQERGEYSGEEWEEVLQAVLRSDKTVEDVPVLQEAPMPQEAPVKRMPHYRFRLWGAAAVMILLAVGGYWRYTHPGRHQQAPMAGNDVAPGADKAVLTLSGGRQLILDSTAADTVLTEGSDIVANASGRLAYNAGSSPGTGIVYNTLTTPKGGQYQLVLCDGTKVWLNAASSLIYPTAFTGDERAVQMTGEVYFEVTHDKKRPFKVKVGGQIIEDIGTHFNVNAYTDEPIQTTTLLEGAVSIGGHTLKPGEKAAVAASGTIQVSKGDPEQAIAWKNGLFDFTDADLPTVMRQLARWYNVDIKYEGNIPERQFTGMIGRSLTLTQVLKGLTRESVQYRIEEGNHLIITH